MIATTIIDDRQLETMIRRIVAEMLNVNPPRPPETGPKCWLVNSQVQADLLRVVEAPDVDAPGIRNEPHWKTVKEIREGDKIVFRDSRAKELVGHAIAERFERGEHRHMTGRPAVRWWLHDSVRYERPIADATFKSLFKQHDDGRAGFSLIRLDGRYNQKAYCYQLSAALRDALAAATRLTK